MKNQIKLRFSLILALLMSVMVLGLSNRIAYAQVLETTPSPQSDIMNNSGMMTSMMRMMLLCSDMMQMTGSADSQQGMQGMMANFGMMDMMMQMMMGSSHMMNGTSHENATPEPGMNSMGMGN